MEAFIPESRALLGVYVALVIARFENQRWVRARNDGLRGSNDEVVGIFIDTTVWLSGVLTWGFVIWFAARVSWREAVGLMAVGFVGSLLYILVTPKGDRLWRWTLGTLAVWPLFLALAWIAWPR